MKKNNLILTLIISLFITFQSFAQVPQYFNYQAVLRNSSGNIIVSQPVNLKISIQDVMAGGMVVFQETHFATTNQFGLVNLKIGNGTQIVGPLSSVPWATGDKFIEVEIDYPIGNGYISMGTQQLLSVPYALHSKTAESISGGITETDPLWSASPSYGISNPNITNWNTAYGWGNHATVGYLTSFTETDPLWSTSPSFGITNTIISNWNTAYGWGNHATVGYLTSYTETDPVFIASPANGITTPLIGDWNAAFSWGNHAGLYKPIEYVPDWTEITNKPNYSDSINNKAVLLTGNQTIAGNKTFTGNVTGTLNANNVVVSNVATPVNITDATNKAYVDSLKSQIVAMENMLIDAGIYTVTDIDGNTYKTSKIGTQVWMAENLKTTKYNNGTPITLITDNTTWYNGVPAYCWYNNDEVTYKSTYGALYNWNTVNTDNLCPIGWHVPSSTEWTTLITYLGGVGVAGGKLKESGTTHWCNPNTGATNETRFTALPGGYRDAWGIFSFNGTYGHWWSSTEELTLTAFFRGMNCNNNGANVNGGYKKTGISVRCLKD